MAATLDTIAEQPGVEAARAESLHQVILSLDLLMTMCLISQILLLFLFLIFGQRDDDWKYAGSHLPSVGRLGDGSTSVKCAHTIQVPALNI